MNTTQTQADSVSTAITSIRAAAGNAGHTCPLCCRPVASPYRRAIGGRIVEGCIDASHSGHVSGASADWHNRPVARNLRAAEAAELQGLVA